MNSWAKTFGRWIAGARCVAAVIILFICAAPVAHSAYHGPGEMVAEAVHLVQHDHGGHAHKDDADGHHNAADHDHVVTDIILNAHADLQMPPDCADHIACHVLGGTQPSKLRRPPRAQLA